MTPKELSEIISAKLEKMEARAVINLNPSDILTIGLLHNILGAQSVIMSQNDEIIRRLPEPLIKVPGSIIMEPTKT